MSAVIETPRLRLREWEAADLDAATALYADAEMTQWIGDGAPRDRDAVAAEIARCRRSYRDRGFGSWAVVLKPAGVLAGHCGLQELDDGSDVALSYALGREFRGKGYAMEAARATLGYGFATLRLKRIVAVTQPVNEASIQVMKKLGMTFESEGVHYGKRVVVYVAFAAQ